MHTATQGRIRIGLLGALAAACIAGPLAGCKTRTVTRADPTEIRDLNYRFDEDDARETADAMIGQALNHPWIEEWREANGDRPIMIVGEVRNDTSDYIDTKLFTKQFERALLNSGRVRIVAASDERDQLRDERASIRDWSRPETVKQMAFEVGADMMLLGRVGENVEVSRRGNVRIQYYQVNLELIDIESNEKLWIGERQIEKRQVDRR
ncbi:MAG: penicillin-binding protein activator LpoB [Phycisphaerales bacterium]